MRGAEGPAPAAGGQHQRDGPAGETSSGQPATGPGGKDSGGRNRGRNEAENSLSEVWRAPQGSRCGSWGDVFSGLPSLLAGAGATHPCGRTCVLSQTSAADPVRPGAAAAPTIGPSPSDTGPQEHSQSLRKHMPTCVLARLDQRCQRGRAVPEVGEPGFSWLTAPRLCPAVSVASRGRSLRTGHGTNWSGLRNPQCFEFAFEMLF